MHRLIRPNAVASAFIEPLRGVLIRLLRLEATQVCEQGTGL